MREKVSQPPQIPSEKRRGRDLSIAASVIFCIHYYKAVESLAWVRRLLTPVQVNIGQNQINLAQ